MAVRVAGVEVIDRDPIEPGAEILFHLPHHIAGESAKIGEPVAIFGRDDEAELMAIFTAALNEGSPIRPVAIRSIELSSPAVPGRSVALQVVKMRMGCPAAELQPNNARLDHDATRALVRASLSCRELQPIGCGLTSADPRAAALAGTGRTRAAPAPATRLRRYQGPAIGLRSRLHHLREERLRPPMTHSTIADASWARAEVGRIVAAHAHDVAASCLKRN